MTPLLALMLAAAQQGAPAPAPAAPAAAPQRFSILADPCARERSLPGTDVVVCGRNAADSPRLPLPAERGPPDRPIPSNPNMSGVGALAASNTPCAAVPRGCQVGVDVFGAGTSAIRLVQKLIAPDSCCEDPGEGTNPALLVKDMVGGIKRTVARKPDKSNRVPIPMDDLPAGSAGK